MAKVKTVFVCQTCGAQSAKWVGKCPSCNSWNTYVEEVVSSSPAAKAAQAVGRGKPTEAIQLNAVPNAQQEKKLLADAELNRVLGGGLVPGAMVLIGGEPGIGKSTLMLQTALTLTDSVVLYVSGEESEQQIKMRADRLGTIPNACYILTETNTEAIFVEIERLNPGVIIVDSIQTLQSAEVESIAGSVSQVRTCTAQLINYAKDSQTPIFIIGHITKDGAIAGPKVLEHMVDTVIQFEGDRHMSYRILRTLKNRFGSTAELGIYEMQQAGLRQVSNPSEILISQKEQELGGITIGATLEGSRPLLVETQSLVTPATYGTPQRSCTGFDSKRLNMLLAVLEKRGGFRLAMQDVFLNIAGGIKIEDPAMDLAVCVSIVSSYNDMPIGHDTCFAAEVGLGGEVRAVNKLEKRIAEAEKLGFQAMYVSKFNLKGIDTAQYSIDIYPFGKLSDLFSHLLG